MPASTGQFSSALHGSDHEERDLELLVGAAPVATLLDLGDLEAELKATLGVDIDLRIAGDLLSKLRDKVVAEARPV